MESLTSIVASLRSFVSSTAEIIATAERLVESNGIEEFSNQNLGSLIGMIHNYKNLLQAANCCNEDQLLSLLGKLQRSGIAEDVKDGVEEFLQAENSWEEFLNTLDEKLECSNNVNATKLDEPENLKGVEFERLAETECDDGKRESIAEIVKDSKWTWAVFLRHFA